MAVASALERPDLITAEIVEASENEDLAIKYGVSSVPHTVINGKTVSLGGVDTQEAFIEKILTLREAAAGAPPLVREGEEAHVDIVIVGAGPGGLTAAIYGERSGLKCVVLEKGVVGGQVALTPVVENYPGLTRVAGKSLVDLMAQHASQYTHIHQGEEVLEIKPNGQIIASTNRGRYICRAVILATGAKHRKLGVPGEERLYGRGVSYCATCDGYFYKGKKVIMVGGGNSAVTEALYLDSLGVSVTLVHRKDKLRAESRLQESLFNRKIPVLRNSEVREILGDKIVAGVRIENTKTGKTEEMPVDGAFISIGYEPVNELAKKTGVELDGAGYVKVDQQQRTNVPRIYAVGDITGGVKQIVTAVGQGAVAAMAAFEDLANPYWKEKGAV
ncbi:MAG TPA: thioredoxin-disulfide reductase [Proteobacteria bacterium]|nr:thioredoxin-disulfide reductase [Pseudomonadota bacterium]